MLEEGEYNPGETRWYSRKPGNVIRCPICKRGLNTRQTTVEAVVEVDGTVFESRICPDCDPGGDE